MLMDNVFEKLSKNETLTDLERLEYLSFMKRLQTVVTTSESQTELTGTASFRNPSIQSPQWRNSPLHPISLQLQTDLPVANTANPFITFEAARIISDVFGVSDDMTKLLVLTPGQYMVDFTARMVWAQNGTGYRNLELVAYDENDVFLGSFYAIVQAGQAIPAANDNVFYCHFKFDQDFFNGIKYCKFRVYQDSGGTLDLRSLVIGMSIC